MTDSRIARCRQALQHNGFEVEYLSNTRKAGEYLRTLIEQSHPHSVSFGDSMTLYATGIIAWLRSQTDIPFIDTFEPGVRFKDLIERRREALTCELFLTGVNAVGEDGTLHWQALLSDLFLTGANAVTEKGELVWLDMIGNRIAPIAFGPRKVVLVAGRNKIVRDTAEAYTRIREIAAPQNVARHEGFKTPCAMTGRCHDCNSPQRICNERLILHKCHPTGRITVVLINDELGL